MGGRGAFSGAEQVIKNYISLNSDGGTSKKIDANKYGMLRVGEKQIQNEKAEHLLVYDKIFESPIAACKGNRHSVAVPNDIDVKDKYITHNHPNENWGGTLSFADIAVATTKNVKALRAVGREKEGVYIMKKTAEANPQALNIRIANDQGVIERKMYQSMAYIKQKFQQGEIKTNSDAKKELRQAFVGVLHNYYRDVMPKYGYIYQRGK